MNLFTDLEINTYERLIKIFVTNETRYQEFNPLFIYTFGSFTVLDTTPGLSFIITLGLLLILFMIIKNREILLFLFLMDF
jgi:hypothetical protein